MVYFQKWRIGFPDQPPRGPVAHHADPGA